MHGQKLHDSCRFGKVKVCGLFFAIVNIRLTICESFNTSGDYGNTDQREGRAEGQGVQTIDAIFTGICHDVGLFVLWADIF